MQWKCILIFSLAVMFLILNLAAAKASGLWSNSDLNDKFLGYQTGWVEEAKELPQKKHLHTGAHSSWKH